VGLTAVLAGLTQPPQLDTDLTLGGVGLRHEKFFDALAPLKKGLTKNLGAVNDN